MARFGLTAHEFLQMTPIEFYCALKDHDEIEIAKIKPACEAIRMSTLWLVNIQLPNRKRVRKAERLFAFTWDKKQDTKPQSPEEMKGVMRAIASATKLNKPRKHRVA